MPLLLDLSPEVVSSILYYLAPDSQSLNALCLTGNHNLLTLTRPYTWIEVNMVLGAEPKASTRTAERLTAFLAEPAKAGAVRALNITLMGPYIPQMPAIGVLITRLAEFANVTHFSLCCIRSRNVFGFGTPGRLVRDVVNHLPSLVSIEVVGCNADISKELEDMKYEREDEKPLLPDPKFTHVATRFCHPTLGDIWDQCPNVRVVEMEGGHGEAFWRREVASDVIQPTTENSSEEEVAIAESLSQFRGYTGSESGIVLSDEVMDVLERLYVKVGAASNDTSDDIWHLANFFHRGACENLKELIIQGEFDVENYRKMVESMRGSVIERVALILEFNELWVPEEFDELLLDHQTNTQPHFFAQFPSLAELRVPCGSLSVSSTVKFSPSTSVVLRSSKDLLAELLSHAPTLRHLFFDAADDSDTLLAPAQKYAELILTLESVSWKNQATFKMERQNGVEVVRKAYAVPLWQEWKGIGKWWES